MKQLLLNGMFYDAPSVPDFWPREGHPETGEAFVEGTVESRTDHQSFQTRPPSPPERTVGTWDSEDNYYEHELSQEEYDLRYRAYVKAREKWTGLAVVRGPTTVYGSFSCESGSDAKGIRGKDGKWFWTEWSVRDTNR